MWCAQPKNQDNRKSSGDGGWRPQVRKVERNFKKGVGNTGREGLHKIGRLGPLSQLWSLSQRVSNKVQLRMRHTTTNAWRVRFLLIALVYFAPFLPWGMGGGWGWGTFQLKNIFMGGGLLKFQEMVRGGYRGRELLLNFREYNFYEA